jgi:hypothetical protein
MNQHTIKIGDTVIARLWSGQPLPATVTALEITEQPRTKYGAPVKSVPFATVRQNRCVFTLQYPNCNYKNWCYSEQIDIPKAG